jgi:hypothetical protein
MLTENPTTDKPFTVSVIKQCIIALKSNTWSVVLSGLLPPLKLVAMI